MGDEEHSPRGAVGFTSWLTRAVAQVVLLLPRGSCDVQTLPGHREPPCALWSSSSCAHTDTREALSSSQGCGGADQGCKGRVVRLGLVHKRKEQTAERMEVRRGKKPLVLKNTNKDKAALTSLALFSAN